MECPLNYAICTQIEVAQAVGYAWYLQNLQTTSLEIAGMEK